jgi:flagellar hook-associated protein 3 FlgL
MTSISTSTAGFYETSRSAMSKLRAQAEALQQQGNTGERLTKSSDDPVAASRLRGLSRLQTLSKVDAANADRASADLTLADSAMSDMADAIIRAQGLATQAATGTLSGDQRKAIASELDQIHANLLQLSNARDSGGHALFGGEAAGDAYTLNAAGKAVYSGTATSEDVPLGEGQSVTRSMTGPQVLAFTDKAGHPSDVMATVKALSDALTTGTGGGAGVGNALADLQTGLDTLTTAQTVVGGRLGWLEVTADRRTDLSAARSTEQEAVGGADLATTVTKLQETLTVLEASQASFTKLSSLSLFDRLG